MFGVTVITTAATSNRPEWPHKRPSISRMPGRHIIANAPSNRQIQAGEIPSEPESTETETPRRRRRMNESPIRI